MLESFVHSSDEKLSTSRRRGAHTQQVLKRPADSDCYDQKHRCYDDDLKYLKLSQQKAGLMPVPRLTPDGTRLLEVTQPSPGSNNMKNGAGDQSRERNGIC